YAEGDLTSHMETAFDDAIKADSLVSVQSLCSSFPAGGQVELYYAESYSLVKFLIDTYGQEKMLELLEVFKQGDQYDDALTKVYGFDLKGLENAWYTSLGL
ncbi:MAG: peptidase MA family metallohydrolase, partial [Dehalococcoidia bacterium]